MTADGLRHRERSSISQTPAETAQTLCMNSTSPSNEKSLFLAVLIAEYMQNIFPEVHEYDMSTFTDVGPLLAAAE